eukprot:7377212-Prymnesium_polylepis.2
MAAAVGKAYLDAQGGKNVHKHLLQLALLQHQSITPETSSERLALLEDPAIPEPAQRVRTFVSTPSAAGPSQDAPAPAPAPTEEDGGSNNSDSDFEK